MSRRSVYSRVGSLQGRCAQTYRVVSGIGEAGGERTSTRREGTEHEGGKESSSSKIVYDRRVSRGPRGTFLGGEQNRRWTPSTFGHPVLL